MTNKLLALIALLLGLIVFRLYLPFLILGWRFLIQEPGFCIAVLSMLILGFINIKRKWDQIK